MLGLLNKRRSIPEDEFRQLQQIWFSSDPLVTCDCPPDRIAQVLEEFTADDLHALAHGEGLEDGPLAEAVVRHPLCDLGSAFEVLHSYSAAAYQSYWNEGKTEADFSTAEQGLFRAFETVSQRASNEGFPTRRFDHNLDLTRPSQSNGRPNPYHPKNWIKWALPDRCLRNTQGRRAEASVELHGGRVLPTFEVWFERHGRLQ